MVYGNNFTRALSLTIMLVIVACTTGCAKEEKVPPVGLLKEDTKMDRRPILAGTWYPAGSHELRAMIEQYISAAELPDFEGRIVGLIVPHAGYIYSGPVAAYSFKALMRDADRYRTATVVMIGPNHRTAGFSGISIWAKGSWLTPLGSTPVDESLANSLLEELGDIAVFDKRVHENEHSLEIELPFLQYALGSDFKIVPVTFGAQSAGASARLASALAGHSSRENIIILASTDLSHYHPESEAHRLDRIFIDGVLSGNADSVTGLLGSGKCEACGYGAVLTLMQAAPAFGADSIIELRYATSADVPAGDRSQVVGYLSALLLDTGKEGVESETPGTAVEPESMEYSLTGEQKVYLLKLARETIERYIRKDETYEPSVPDDPKLISDGAVFVTLHENGMLRGCIGQMVAQGPLYLCVRDMAISSATRDHRFRPVSEDELDGIDIEISVLSPMKPIGDWREIVLGHHGVWLVRGNRSGVFLPQVGRNPGWTLEYFLEELSSQKAGMPRDAYKDPGTQLFVFTVVEFDEHQHDLR